MSVLLPYATNTSSDANNRSETTLSYSYVSDDLTQQQQDYQDTVGSFAQTANGSKAIVELMNDPGGDSQEFGGFDIGYVSWNVATSSEQQNTIGISQNFNAAQWWNGFGEVISAANPLSSTPPIANNNAGGFLGNATALINWVEANWIWVVIVLIIIILLPYTHLL